MNEPLKLLFETCSDLKYICMTVATTSTYYSSTTRACLSTFSQRFSSLVSVQIHGYECSNYEGGYRAPSHHIPYGDLMMTAFRRSVGLQSLSLDIVDLIECVPLKILDTIRDQGSDVVEELLLIFASIQRGIFVRFVTPLHAPRHG